VEVICRDTAPIPLGQRNAAVNGRKNLDSENEMTKTCQREQNSNIFN
jgi:hypothetical protein